MGYVRQVLAAPGTPLHLMIRGAAQPAVAASMPFVPTRYFKP
jgi:glycine cleavage system aminomethyltransferase T